jgi:hypothetical protein
MRKVILFSMMALSIALGGCINSEGDGSSDPISSGFTYYFDEFQDVPVPNEMKVQNKDTYITYSGEGIKLGTQCFSGRVEMASLVKAMYSHMQREGWTLRSVFRSSRSIMIFEKPEKMCSIYISDGMLETSMLMFISPKLQKGALQYSVPASTSTEPAMPGDPVIGNSTSSTGSNPNVTVYPAK